MACYMTGKITNARAQKQMGAHQLALLSVIKLPLLSRSHGSYFLSPIISPSSIASASPTPRLLSSKL